MTDTNQRGVKSMDGDTLTVEQTLQNMPVNRSQRTGTAPDAQDIQSTNDATAEDDLDPDPTATNSDTEVREVMEGLKTWTKSPPFPDDAGYFFPKETRERRQRAERGFRLRGLFSLAHGGGREREEEKEVDFGIATGGPAPEGLLSMRAGADKGNRISCIPCMVHHTECVYAVGAKSCGGCLSRKERCVLYVEVE